MLRMVIVMTPSAITAAAPIAIRADMLNMIFLWRVFLDEREVLADEVEELGLRTIGLGRTVGQERFTTEPQRPGLSEREEGGMALKKFPAGRSPEKRLWDMLKERRWGRLESCFGRFPLSRLNERSTL